MIKIELDKPEPMTVADLKEGDIALIDAIDFGLQIVYLYKTTLSGNIQVISLTTRVLHWDNAKTLRDFKVFRLFKPSDTLTIA